MLWLLILLFVMGFIAGGFILGAVHNAYLLVGVGVLFGLVAASFTWNTYWGRRAIMGFITHYPDSELRTAKNGQFVKVSGVCLASLCLTYCVFFRSSYSLLGLIFSMLNHTVPISNVLLLYMSSHHFDLAFYCNFFFTCFRIIHHPRD